MIGPFDEEILIGNIVSTPPGIIVSPFYEYSGGYLNCKHIKIGKR